MVAILSRPQCVKPPYLSVEKASGADRALMGFPHHALLSFTDTLEFEFQLR